MSSKIGIHAIRPNQVIPLVRQARDRGVVWPVVKAVDNGGVSIDVKAIEPRTKTIFRAVWSVWDGTQGVEFWSPTTRRDIAQTVVNATYARLNVQERSATDWLEPTNEADPPSVVGWSAFGLYLSDMIDQANALHIKLALPAFNAGTPEWSEMQALVATGVFGKMKAGGHILTIHEGVFGADPVDKGYGDLIPGAPVVPGAGSMCFRYRYLYSLLATRDEVVPLVISEFYGGSYKLPPAEQVARFAWYDRECRRDPYVLAFLPFTIDPSPGWEMADYTFAYGAVLDYVEREKDVPVPVAVSVFKTGLHGRADGRMQAADFNAVTVSKVNAVKLLSTAAPSDVDTLRNINPAMFVIVRLYIDLRNGRKVSAQNFVDSIAVDFENFYQKGVRYFEVHNEPNLTLEGLGGSWAGGKEFGDWFIQVGSILRALHSDVLLGWPGTSPGAGTSLREDESKFLDEAGDAPMTADWIGQHIYWISETELGAVALQIAPRRDRYPGKPIYITEFSNPNQLVDKGVKGDQYVRFYQTAARVYGVAGAFAFVSSASQGFQSETWANGGLSVIPGIVGARPNEVTVTRARGIDVSGLFQDPTKMRYADWRQLGYAYGFYETYIGEMEIRWHAEHRAAMRAAGYLTGPYQALHECCSPSEQCRLFLASRGVDDEMPNMIDIERRFLTRAIVDEWLDYYDTHSRDPLWIYTSSGTWPVHTGSGREYRYGLLVASYGPNLPGISDPPPGPYPSMPIGWSTWLAWQFSGQGRLPGYANNLDLEVYNGTEQELFAKYKPTGDIPMTPEELLKIQQAAKSIEDIANKYLNAPWWTKITGPFPVKLSTLNPPPAPLQIYHGNGQPFNPPVFKQNSMDVFAVNGDLLEVYAPSDWWIRAEDVLKPAGY